MSINLISRGNAAGLGGKKMLSIIYELNSDGIIKKIAEYSCNPQEALINYIMQYKCNNWNTWEYPKMLKGIRESKTVKNHFYFDYGNTVIAAYPA